MSPEAQRIAIAEACGWEFRPYEDTRAWWKGGAMVWNEIVRRLSDNIPTDPLPDYLNDLNAVHDACEQANIELGPYYRALAKTMSQDPDFMGHPNEMIHATAAQRAEAFLKTLNLWEE